MERDEILRRAQEKTEQMDERELQVSLKGYRCGMLFGMIACFVLMLFKIFRDQPWQDAYAIFCIMDCAQYLYLWINLKNRRHLLSAILWGAAGIALFAVYLMQIF